MTQQLVQDEEGEGFWMGSTDKPAQPNEAPRHHVTLDPFWIDKTEVTNAQYKQCVDAGVCEEPREKDSKTRAAYFDNPAYDRFPVIHVTYYDAERFCKHYGARLPTEAEWEYAARGPDGNQFPWDSQLQTEHWANIAYWKGDTFWAGVLSRDRSYFGVMDMAGNVREWVYDWFGNYLEDDVNNSEGPESGNAKVIRGGGWLSSVNTARSAARGAMTPNTSTNYLGFRCAADAVTE